MALPHQAADSNAVSDGNLSCNIANVQPENWRKIKNRSEFPKELGRSSKVVDDSLACRLHVSNLPFIFRETHLATLFSSYGTVTDAEVVTNEKGSKGFGFVSLGSPEEAASAQRALQGAVVEGRRIEVNRATPRAKPLPMSQFLSFPQVNHQSQMLQLVEAQTRLAEAQLAVLQMRKAILNPQVNLMIDRFKVLSALLSTPRMNVFFKSTTLFMVHGIQPHKQVNIKAPSETSLNKL